MYLAYMPEVFNRIKHISLMYRGIHSVLFLVLLSTAGTLHGQVAQTNRVEIELGDEYTGQKVYLFGKKGLILLSKSYESSANEIRMKFELFNTDLKKVSDKEVALEYLKGYNITYADDDRLWIFFHNYKKGMFTIVEFNPEDGVVKRHKGNVIPGFNVDYFRILNGKAYLGGKYKKKPFISIFDLSAKTNDYPELDDLKRKTYISSLKITEDKQQVHVLFSACESSKECVNILIPFDRNGKKMSRSIVVGGDTGENKLSSCTTSGLKSGGFMALGTYSEKSFGMAQGVYMTRFDENSRKYIRYYNFLEFKNFLSYLPERRQEKIERKKERKSARGKEMKINYQMVMHELIEREGEYIFIGEAYYPTYRTESYTSIGPNGSTITHTRSVFDGYQYTHAAIASFDKEGNMNWSNTFEMWLANKPYFPKKFITVSFLDDKMNLLFATGAKIVSKSFQNGDSKGDVEIEIVKTGDENDKLRWSSATDVEHWYGNVFLADGFQKIVNRDKKSGDRRRKVYYLNKIEY